jgi:cytoskeletal protein CcmA (bactofilin family)
MTFFAMLAIMLLAFLALPMLSFAADVHRGSDVTIGAGQILREDAYLVGGEVNFRGRAERDVSVLAGRVTITGTIAGSLNLAAGRAEIPGRIGGALRIAGGDVTITGTVGGDVIVLGGKVNIPSRAKIGGDLILAGGQVDVRGSVGGDITGNVGQLTLGGTVSGNVDVATSSIDIRNTTVISGNLTYHSNVEGDVSSSAEIRGTVDRPSSNPWDSVLDRGGFFGPILRALWSLVVGVALILVAPGIAQAVSTSARRPLAAAGVGLLALIVVPILAVILMVSVIGLPVGLLLITGYLIALYLSQVAVGLAIGRFILPHGWHDGSRGYFLLAMTLGVIILVALRLIPVPWVATIVGAAVTLWGFGALIMLIGKLGRVEVPPSPSSV